MIGLVKDIVHRSTGKPLGFVCHGCKEAFLYPTAAVNDYLCSLSSHPFELSAHQRAERLRQRGNSCHMYRHPSGVVVGTCTTCDETKRDTPKKRAASYAACLSTRHASGRAVDARYTPSPMLFHLLWTPQEAEAERGVPRDKLRKACSGCRSSAARQSRAERLLSSDRAAGAGDGAPSDLSGGPDAVGLKLLSSAASTQENLSLSSLLPSAAATPNSPTEPSGLDATSVAVIAPERPGCQVAVCAGPAFRVSPGPSREYPAHVSLSVAGSDVAPDAGHWSTEQMLEDLLRRYDSFGGAELRRFEALLTKHLRETRPSEISFKFKNGVNRLYTLWPAATSWPVGPWQMRRRVLRTKTAAELAMGKACLSPNLKSLLAVLHAARKKEGVSVVPTRQLHRLSLRAQAQFSVQHDVSATTMNALRQALGGKHSGVASREDIRREMTALSQEPGRQVHADDRGAHLLSVRAALKGLCAELVTSGEFVDRHVRGLDGAPVPHTAPFLPSQEPYTQHKDETADVHVCLGLDKGGRGTATSKLVMTTPNQRRPMTRATNILLSTMPCVSDNNAELHKMIGPWVQDIEELLANGIQVAGTLRAVRLSLNGDLAFLSGFLGHQGASARQPCVWCTAVSRPSGANAALVADHGHLQDPVTPPVKMRTRMHLLKMMEAYKDDANDSLPLPLRPSEHLSIELPPLYAVYPSQVVVAPLHLTLGVTQALLRLGFEAAYLEGGPAVALEAVTAVGTTLLDDVSVHPVAYHGGGFEGRECHRIRERSRQVCDALALFLSANRMQDLRDAWNEWTPLSRTLNRAQDISAAEAADFGEGARRFALALLAAFPWMSVTPKLHALTHRAPAFLTRFGSLGSYGEQALEAWHGWFNHSTARRTADSFLGTCVRFM